eukprot:scaffold1881_cov256-Pinguiococcus_pyrenoidosus.AAC.18
MANSREARRHWAAARRHARSHPGTPSRMSRRKTFCVFQYDSNAVVHLKRLVAALRPLERKAIWALNALAWKAASGDARLSASA